MRRAATLFTDEDRQRIARTVADAESRTSAEIVPVVAGDSGRYDRSEDVVGLWMGLALMAVMWYALPGGRSEPGSWDPGSWDAVPAGIELAALIGAMLVGFVVGAIVGSRVGWLRRLFTPARLTIDDKTYVVVLQAEFERLQSLAGTAIADDGPALPPPHDDGTYPALEYAGASLARKIIRQRRELGLTQADLARRARIRPETLNRLEKGKSSPDVATVDKIDLALKTAKAEQRRR